MAGPLSRPLCAISFTRPLSSTCRLHSTTNGFREEFEFPSFTTNWFPGHMARGLRLMSERIRHCDCIVEVHDARDFLELLKRRGEEEVLYTNLKNQHHPTIRELKSLILKVTQDRGTSKDADLRFMVVGMPNVGKSSLINALRRNYLRKGKAAAIGKLPGITKAVSTKIKVAENPTMYLMDTPGVMMPSVPSDEVALKLAVLGMLRDHLVGETLIADYLLFKLNRSGNFEYAKFCNLDAPSDDIVVVLDKFSQRIGALKKGGTYDHVRAAQHFLKRFRDGLLGRLTLDTLTSY